ncbi:MAG: LCP family protein [Clostridia bacterium]|nr:LCP family protein [Clostridia bacterium]
MNPQMNKRHPKKHRLPVWKIVLAVITVMIFLTIAGLATFLKVYKPSVDTDVPPFLVDTVEPDGTMSDTVPVDTSEDPTPENVYVRDTEIVNFLVMGRDKDAWNTDVMMIVNFNMRDGSLSVLQIPRDTYTEVDGMHGRLNTMMKIKRNAAYSEDKSLSQTELLKAGMQGTVEALEKSLCIQIDGYAIVNLEGFRNIIDVIGGVYMDVPYDMDYDDPDQNLYIHLSAGPQTLDGAEAEMFVRFRSGFIQGDIGRVNAQKIFLTALFKQLQTNLTLTTVPQLAEQVVKYVTTDVPLADIIIYAKELLGVDMAKVSMMTLPGKDARATSGAWYYIMHREDTLSVINEYFNVYNLPVTSEMFDPTHAFTDEDFAAFADIYFAEAAGAVVETADKIDEDGLNIPLY